MLFNAELKKIGNSRCVIIPAKMIKKFNLDSDKYVQIEIQKFISQFKKTAMEAKIKGEIVNCTFGDKQVSGKVCEVDDNLTIFNEEQDCTFFIPFSIIQSVSTG